MHFCLRNSVNGATRARLVMLLFVAAFLALTVTAPAQSPFRKKGKKGGDTPATPAAAEPKVPPGMAMSKTQAVFALIMELRKNQSNEALQTLEQIVLGKISFGAHDKQAAETALAALALRQSPAASAFLLKLLSEPDDKLRPGDTAYPAANVRYDAVRVGCRVGSPELRAGLAKAYDRATPEIRSAIEFALSTPSAANFSAQLVLVRSRSLPDPLRSALQKVILDHNALALRQALKLTGDAPAKDAASAGALSGLLGIGNPSTGNAAAGSPAAAAPGTVAYRGGSKLDSPVTAPVGPAAAAAAAQNPMAFTLETTEKLLNAQPSDPAVVARELWQNDVVEALAMQLAAAQKLNAQQTLAAVGSIPLKTARERLRAYLLEKSPQELGAQEQPPAAPADGQMGRGKGMGAGRGQGKQAAPTGPKFVVGADWLDPGTIVVLKTLPYRDRPKTRHKTPPPGAGSKRNAAAEKRAEELAEKQKKEETQYEWRDTIERFVSHWDDRLGEAAESKEAASTDKDADAGKADAKETKGKSSEKSKAGASTPTKVADAAAKKSTRSAEKKDESESKAKGAGAPTPAVALPFALRPGEKITKEFHLRWPEDLPANLTAAISEPLVIHYVQLEGTDDVNRTATFYRSAMSKGSGSKDKPATHDIESGKWVDVLQRDLNGQRTRSFDVLVTRQPPEPGAKKSKIEELTIQVLMVEVESFEPEAKQPEKKEQVKADRP
jgi:hypothetical protein